MNWTSWFVFCSFSVLTVSRMSSLGLGLVWFVVTVFLPVAWFFREWGVWRVTMFVNGFKDSFSLGVGFGLRLSVDAYRFSEENRN